MEVPQIEKELGIEVYATQSLGIGGRIRRFYEDFVVKEILIDGSIAEIRPMEIQPPIGRGRHLICVLVKRNWDTFLAIEQIAKRLGIDPERIQIGGIKDARALTAQHISISRFTHKQVSQLQVKDVVLSPLRSSNEKISYRWLQKNQFLISIRDLSHTVSEVKTRIQHVQDELLSLGGCPNFFGHQRFGTIRPITHLVSRLLIRGELENAALTFLAKTSPYENPKSRVARQRLLDTQNFKDALHTFPKNLRYERWMLHHLAKHPKDFAGAHRRLPLRLRRLFIHAYQSFLFNKFLSQRIKRGIPLNEAEIGDYALRLDDHGLPTTHFEQVTAQSIQSIEKALKERRMQIAIPLVGFRQPCSGGIQGEVEREILEDENVDPEDFYLSFMPEISAPGTLRTSLTSVIDFSIEKACKDSTNLHKRKVRLSFALLRGSYATILLREFMKSRDLIKAAF